MFCPNCGAQNEDGIAFCASCGSALNEQAQQPVYQQPVYQQPAPQQPVYQQPAPQRPVVPGKGMAITSMVLGIVALVLFCIFYIAIPCGIVALVLGIVAKNKASAVGMKSGMATAGIVCSCIALGITVLYLLIAAVGCASMGLY